MIGLDLSDIGLAPVDTAPAVVEVVEETAPAQDDRLIIGSVLSKALYSVWSGQPVTIVDSPPGAGKTTLLVDLAQQLMERTDLKVIVATPTRNGAADVAGRMGIALGKDDNKLPQVVLDIKDVDAPNEFVMTRGAGTASLGRTLVVRTVASCTYSPPKCDVLIVDEAYQSTFANVSTAAENADQIIMVGDPGQIGPVVQTAGRMFAGRRVSPEHRAPEAFRLIHDCELLALRTTYRLGQDTVDAIAPLYDFDFDSSRPDRWVEDVYGNRVDEVRAVQMPATGSYTDTTSVQNAVNRAVSFIGMTLAETQPDGTVTRRVLQDTDVAIVAAHNAQVTAATAMLDTLGHKGVTAGTADSLQGGQWHAVVALDPLVGHATAGPHQLSPGRLCVMASRHMTAMVWMFEEGWAEALLDDQIDGREADLGRIVRSRLTSGEVEVIA